MGGAGFEAMDEAAQVKGAEIAASSATGDATAGALGDALETAPAGTAPAARGRSALIANMTPMATAAIKTAATPKIQNGRPRSTKNVFMPV
ncbi:MAG: hypothetical protein ACHQ7M_23530 [Chloroflexota bacterium]